MKKIAMLLALSGMLSVAQAQNPPPAGTQVVDLGQDILVKVQNVCAFVGGPVIDSQFDQNSSELHPDAIQFNYKATASSSGSQRIFNIRCTAGTPVRVTRGSADGSPMVSDESYKMTLTPTAQVNANKPGLEVNVTENLKQFPSSGDNNSPDRYTLNTRVQAPAGQWGVVAGDYAGVLEYRFAYDE